MIELGIGFGIIAVYFIIAATTALLLRRFVKIPDEIFRKTLHAILLLSLAVWLYAFQTWWIAVIATAIFELIVFPILLLLERLKNFSKIVTERNKGELKFSLLLVFTMFIIVTCVCWGWLNDRLLALASIYAWGIGDAAAALIGKRFGKHKIKWKLTDGKKSFAGSLAMFVASAVSVTILLIIRGGLPVYAYAIIPTVTAAVATLAELYSKNGLDTIICPISAMATLLPLLYLFGGLL